MCIKDCGPLNQINDTIILFACLVGWLNSLPVEIKNKEQSFKKTAWAGMNISMAT